MINKTIKEIMTGFAYFGGLLVGMGFVMFVLYYFVRGLVRVMLALVDTDILLYEIGSYTDDI